MKIAFLSFYSGEVARGGETFVHEVANRLTGFGHKVIVFQNGPKLSGSKYITKTIGLEVDWEKKSHKVPILNYRSFLVGRFTLKVLKDLDSDVDVIFPTNGQLQAIFTSIWSKFHRTKLVISGQSGPGIDDRINLFTFPNIFLGLTDSQVAWAKKANPLVRVSKIPNGADVSRFNKKVDPIKVSLPSPIILSVAALNSWKRLDLIIKAVSKLEKGSLLLVGRGDQKMFLKKLAEKLLPGRFAIKSFPYKDMHRVYPAADIFVYSTTPSESFGIVMVEAMASGLAVVATNDPIRREIVGEAGMFVDPTNTEKFAESVKRALKKDWGDIPRKQAEKFSWDKIAKKYEELFNEPI